MIFRATGLTLIAIILVMGGAAHGALTISSPDFAAGQPMPAKYAQKGKNISPALRMQGVPEQAKSLVLIVDDPDAPRPQFTHWLVWGIDVHHAQFLEGRAPRGATQGTNTMGHVRYDGPNPPSGTHRYFFRLYALDQAIDLPATADRAAVEAAMQGHVVAKAEMFGTYAAK